MKIAISNTHRAALLPENYIEKYIYNKYYSEYEQYNEYILSFGNTERYIKLQNEVNKLTEELIMQDDYINSILNNPGI